MKIYIQVKSKSREAKIIKDDINHYTIYIKELPEKGRANKAIITSLSNHFHIAKSQISILSGLSSRQKVININCS